MCVSSDEEPYDIHVISGSKNMSTYLLVEDHGLWCSFRVLISTPTSKIQAVQLWERTASKCRRLALSNNNLTADARCTSHVPRQVT
jgi:hypothetical protein